MRVLSQCFEQKGDGFQAEAWGLKAAAEAPYSRDPWCRLAQVYYGQKRWEECLGMARRALAIKHREMVYTCDPVCWAEQPHDQAAIALWNLGRFEEGLGEAQKALDACPADSRLMRNVLHFKEMLDTQKAGSFGADEESSLHQYHGC